MMGYLDTRIRMLTERYTAEVEKEKQSMAEMSHNPENFKNMERMRIYERTHKMYKEIYSWNYYILAEGIFCPNFARKLIFEIFFKLIFLLG